MNSTETALGDFVWARERMVQEQVIARGIDVNRSDGIGVLAQPGGDGVESEQRARRRH